MLFRTICGILTPLGPEDMATLRSDQSAEPGHGERRLSKPLFFDPIVSGEKLLPVGKAINLGGAGAEPPVLLFRPYRQRVNPGLEILVVFTRSQFLQIPLTAVVVVVINEVIHLSLNICEITT